MTELDRIKAMPTVERARAAAEYVRKHRQAVAEGEQVRDAAVVEIASQAGPTAASRIAGLSLGRVKQLRAASRV